MCALFIGLSLTSNAICLAFPLLFSLISLPNFHPKTLHQDHDIQNGITLCARTCTRIKQTNPTCLHILNRSSGFTAQISADFIYPEHSPLGLLGWHVAQETKPSVYFSMEELPMLGHAKCVKTCWAMRGNPGISVLVPPEKEEDLTVHLTDLQAEKGWQGRGLCYSPSLLQVPVFS